METLRVRLHVISPIHIGCDDVYEPTSFVIDEGRKRLISFDPLEFIHSLNDSERERFTSISSEGTIASIVKIYQFLSGREVKGREVEITDDLISHFRQVKALPLHDEKRVRQELNKFSIGRTAYDSYTSLPYIPGSAIKGAMRTAYLSKLAKESNLRDGWKRFLTREELKNASLTYKLISKKEVSKKLEKSLLKGDFATDPFRMVKVSDFRPVGEVGTRILYAINKRKKPSKFNARARGPSQILETIKEGTVFEGIIDVIQPHEKTGIERPVRVRELLKALNSFFIPQVNEENKTLKEIDVSPLVVKAINGKFKENLGRTAFLIRLGKHSGAEAVTIEGNRLIKIMQAKDQPPKFLDHATTIWLASTTRKPSTNRDLIPFGWAVMEIVQ